MNSELHTAIRVLREEGVYSLWLSIRWYLVARNAIPLFPTRPELFRRYLAFRRFLQPSKYTDADPFKVVWVEPERIEYAVRGRRIPLSFGRVADGDWDLGRIRFEYLPVAAAILNHYTDGVPWEKTTLYERFHNRLQAGEPIHGCRSVDDVDEYFSNIENLATNIEEFGYQTQPSLLEVEEERTWAKTERDIRPLHPILNEVGINIGRNGELLWRHRGQHRLAVAKALDIDEIPVQILTRHSDWQAKRDAAAEGSETANHPDLRDLQKG